MNHWLPIRTRGVPFGVAYIQAFSRAPRRRTAQKPFARAAARTLSRPKFLLAGQLFALIIQHVQSLDLAELQKEELGKVRQSLCVFENVLARLREKLNGVLPAFSKSPPVLQPESRSECTVHAVLARIQRDYGQPLTLRKCAGDLRLNAAYLSHLFSQAAGLPFKSCLTEVRIEKAQELLGDPAKNISDVAKAVGYASTDRFRAAFREATGLSPRLWRETLQLKPPPG